MTRYCHFSLNGSRRFHRGFTLAEALISVTFAALVITLVGRLSQSMISLSARMDARDRTGAQAHAILDIMASDVRRAVEVIAPDPGTLESSSTLSLRLLDPSYPRLPNEIPTLPPASFDPLPASALILVTYAIETDGTPSRETDAQTEKLNFASPVAGYAGRWRENRLELELKIKAGVVEDTYVRTVVPICRLL